MKENRVRRRRDDAEMGLAMGGSGDRLRRQNDRIRSVTVVVLLSVAICALIVGVVVIGVKLSVADLSGKDNRAVSICYGDLVIKTDRELAYEGSNPRVDMNCVRDMLGISMARDKNEIIYSTSGGDTIKLTVGESVVSVNGISFSLCARTVEESGKIFASAEVVNAFIYDTSVAEDKENNKLTVITLITDPSEVRFSPKKSDQMSGMDRPSSIPSNTTYDPEGTTPDKVTTSSPDVTTPESTTPESTTPAVTEDPLGRESRYDEIISGYTFTIDITPYLDYLRPENEEGYLIVANRKHPLGEDYVPSNLVPVTSKTSLKLEETANKALEAMINEMKAQKVFDTYVCSAYRDYAYQYKLYNKYITQEKKNHPNYTEAEIIALVDSYSARPGTSDHQTGLTIDFYDVEITFENKKAFDYLKENAYKFGFIMRYPKGKEEITGYSYEPWHWRFVGQEAAYEIYTKGITLEEYVGILD